MIAMFTSRRLVTLPGVMVPGIVYAKSPDLAVVTPTATYFVKLGLSLLLVVGLVFALAWLMKRFNGLHPNANTGLSVISSVSLGSRERLVIVEAGNTQILVGVTPGQISKLHILEEKMESGHKKSANGFRKQLEKVRKEQ